MIAETGWLLESRLGASAEVALYELVASGALAVHDLAREDWRRITELADQYRDHPLGGVDASLITVAERLGADTIATLDQRHFRAVRPKHVKALKIVP